MPLCFHLHGINHVALSFHMLNIGSLRLLVEAGEHAGKVHDIPARWKIQTSPNPGLEGVPNPKVVCHFAGVDTYMQFQGSVDSA